MNLASLRVRVVLGAVVSAIVTLLVVWAASWATAELWFGAPPIPASAVARCEADPAAFTENLLDLATVFAYDEAGVAANPAAPPLDPAHAADLLRGRLVRFHDGDERVVVARAAPSGPCTLMRIAFRPPKGGWNGWLFGIGLGAVLAVVLVSWLSYRVSVVPLVRRIHRIRDAAVLVGGEGYVGAAEDVPDALGEIGETLDRSDARIRSDRAELIARHRALEEHLGEIAHDLRTPIASLVLALQEVAAASPNAHAANRALGDATYLAALVDNLHQATRLRHGLDPADGDTDLRDVVERLGHRFAAIGRAEGVEVATSVPDGPVRVRCAPALAERAIANLVHNAVSHGAARVAVILEEGPAFQLTVLDDGPGVPDVGDLAVRTFLTDPARPRGPGLGLAITNEVARRVGWAIRYEAAEPGLRVTVEGPTV